ncbi:MAG TPA: PRC-barrel domain-containing protein, partial [Nitrospiraceae bacterium]|nr:PRC-barrel domain-containing protein [Nitrospiraceae bacterium]
RSARYQRRPPLNRRPGDLAETTTGGEIAHPVDLKNLNELDDYQVGADDADPRGWQVTATDGRGIGRVADLIVDTDSMKVRYLDVEVDRALSPTATACGSP